MFTYIPQSIPNRILVIGAGGTGGRLIPMLAQFIRSITNGPNPLGFLMNPEIIVVDDDVVETKNLTRQLFIERDVGQPKALVMANRYNPVYTGVTITPVTERITSQTYLSEIMFNFNGDAPLMVIMCVDSIKARQDILHCLMRNIPAPTLENSPFIIDAGNEADFGQVKFFNLVECQRKYSLKYWNFPEFLPFPYRLSVIPFDWRYYRDMKESQSALGCAELDQTLAINAAMATGILGVVQNFYYRKEFRHNGFSIALNGANSTEWNTLRWLESLGDTPFSGRQHHKDRTYLSTDSVFQAYKGNIREHQQMLEEKARIEAEERRLKEEAEQLKKEAAEQDKGENGDQTSPSGSGVKRVRKGLQKPTSAQAEEVPVPVQVNQAVRLPSLEELQRV